MRFKPVILSVLLCVAILFMGTLITSCTNSDVAGSQDATVQADGSTGASDDSVDGSAGASRDSTAKDDDKSTSTDKSTSAKSAAAAKSSTTTKSGTTSKSAAVSKSATTAKTSTTTKATQQTQATSTCTITIDGYCSNKSISLQGGDTVYSILKRSGASVSGSSSYVKGINGLYEFDKGPQSGWMYSVNGVTPNVSCGSYKVKAGDKIKWYYVTSY